MSFDFTAIDFETANGNRSSACSLALVKVRDGVIVDRFDTLLKPESSVNDFDDRNIQVHGISPADVEDAPEFREIAPQLYQFIAGDTLVAHNANFDQSVLNSVCDLYDLEPLPNDFVCTLDLSRKTLSLAINKLPFVVKALGLPEFEHHKATADAEAVVQVVLTLAEQEDAHNLEDLVKKAGSRYYKSLASMAEALASGETDLQEQEFNLDGKRICITGSLFGADGKSLTRKAAQGIIEQQGGIVEQGVTKKTNYLVHGVDNPSSFAPGATMSGKLKKALQLSETGQDIEIITSDEFFELIDVSAEYIRALNLKNRPIGVSRLPGYALERIQEPGFDFTYNYSFLNHPEGRAEAGQTCVWCGLPIEARAHHTHRDRHVCGISCNESLKQSAKRQIRKLGKMNASYNGPQWYL